MQKKNNASGVRDHRSKRSTSQDYNDIKKIIKIIPYLSKEQIKIL